MPLFIQSTAFIAMNVVFTPAGPTGALSGAEAHGKLSALAALVPKLQAPALLVPAAPADT